MVMIKRPFWEKRIKDLWKKAPIIWLSGPRRCGKTTLAKMLSVDNPVYVNCDLPSSGDMLKNPELFFRDCAKKTVIFDEIHNLKDPAATLKIGADMFPDIKILATGSSTLAAGKKFRDTLTGRKRNVRLLPVLYGELDLFGGAGLEKRLLHGGLPQAVLSDEKDFSFYREWADSFFSRDIQKLFGFRDWEKFNLLFEYIMRQSSGLFDASKAASSAGLSRSTVGAHLSAMETTGAVALIRPFSGGGRGELVKMPKVYGFDTGFVSFFRGWETLRPPDKGVLWEHLVLESLMAFNPDSRIMYWRDKSGREIDFVVQGDHGQADTFECKWNPDEFSPDALKVFRKNYPKGSNYVICPISTEYKRNYDGLVAEVTDITRMPGSGLHRK